MPDAKKFLQQTVNRKSDWEETQKQLKALADAWPF
jgi:hypothetical protein